MNSKLTNYLKNNKWRNSYFDEVLTTCNENGYSCCSTWDLILNSECYAYIVAKNGGYVYGEDCPDVNMPIEDYFQDIFFEDEEKLIQFLEELKLTKPA